ncbi:MAG TPA: exodeoxyribonuclease VII large subunit [Sumerlaeia bacterium]|nr:exodeoxyribonuclease VII large subunit [Sumerlaeia bacterium]
MVPSVHSPPDGRPLSVTELTRAIKRLLETGVGAVEVEGEISNWTVSARGHVYFALKDDAAVLSCVLFQNARSRLAFRPSDGMKVIAKGDISVYEARGQYQMIVSSLKESGLGDLFRRFLALKEKLEKEGLFDEGRKRPLPALPRRIGVVTSATGAAWRDIVHVIRRRSPCVEIILSPTLVQGNEAPAQITHAIERLNRLSAARPWGADEGGIDVMIVGRGGGSIEDLWAFNDERVARAIYASAIPVVSAVGHETDFTIADFVADVRAPTPSAAAEIVVADAQALVERVANLRRRLGRTLQQMVETRRLQLRRLTSSWGLRQPLDLVHQAIQRVDDLAARAEASLERAFMEARHRLESATGRLHALDPKRVLERGYSIVSRARDGRVVTRERQVRVCDHLRIQLSEGELRAAVLPPGDDIFDGPKTGAPDSGPQADPGSASPSSQTPSNPDR